ncbi:hypothetical protein PIB30_018491 [Stylosanthes scabra]|uniref:Mei2-like C-terminal RNA recognition motif domain-containing protein n=1 Tax=Stylosanthes scabra TaxID=79078 RepID=A0ABU6W8X6_9FABA|nr:hypothetical protein [Stylosanthes scabra]
MVPKVTLNPEAPEFFPSVYEIHMNLPITWPYATSAVPPPPPPPPQPPCQQIEYVSVQPNCSLYLPTIPVPLQFPVTTNSTLLSSPPSSVVVDDELLLTDSPKQQKQAFHYENGELLMNIRVGPRRSYHHHRYQQQQAQKWRPKKVVKEEKEEEEKEQENNINNNKLYGYGGNKNHHHHHHLKGRQDFRRSSEHHGFNTFPKKKRGFFPISPVRENGSETTVMIKNIPSRYTRDDLVAFLDNHCMVENSKDDEGVEKTSDVLAFDFVYLPIDFKKGFNKGYAFVNFTSPKAAWKFHITASNRKWELFQSQKVRQVVAARIQGKENLEKRFESMIFPCESMEVLPVCFSVPRDGKNKSGEQKTLGLLMKRRHYSSANLIKV